LPEDPSLDPLTVEVELLADWWCHRVDPRVPQVHAQRPQHDYRGGTRRRRELVVDHSADGRVALPQHAGLDLGFHLAPDGDKERRSCSFGWAPGVRCRRPRLDLGLYQHRRAGDSEPNWLETARLDFDADGLPDQETRASAYPHGSLL